MSLDVIADVNWLAVLVAGLVWFVLGAAWYIPPVMGSRWQAYGGIDVPEDAKPNQFGWFWINGVFNLIGLTVVGAIIGAFGT